MKIEELRSVLEQYNTYTVIIYNVLSNTIFFIQHDSRHPNVYLYAPYLHADGSLLLQKYKTRFTNATFDKFYEIITKIYEIKCFTKQEWISESKKYVTNNIAIPPHDSLINNEGGGTTAGTTATESKPLTQSDIKPTTATTTVSTGTTVTTGTTVPTVTTGTTVETTDNKPTSQSGGGDKRKRQFILPVNSNYSVFNFEQNEDSKFSVLYTPKKENGKGSLLGEYITKNLLKVNFVNSGILDNNNN